MHTLSESLTMSSCFGTLNEDSQTLQVNFLMTSEGGGNRGRVQQWYGAIPGHFSGQAGLDVIVQLGVPGVGGARHHLHWGQVQRIIAPPRHDQCALVTNDMIKK
jgi:hypothetical protein